MHSGNEVTGPTMSLEKAVELWNYTLSDEIDVKDLVGNILETVRSGEYTTACAEGKGEPYDHHTIEEDTVWLERQVSDLMEQASALRQGLLLLSHLNGIRKAVNWALAGSIPSADDDNAITALAAALKKLEA